MKLVDLDDSQTSANDSSRDLTLSDLITGAAVRFPRRPAVRHDSSTVTYGDLLRLREKIGAAIVNLCRSPGQQLVGVFMERSSEMVASLLAVHQTGNAFVPMDPSLPTGAPVFHAVRLSARVDSDAAVARIIRRTPGDAVCLC